jgi:ABC-type lipoprotein export system ATPase subunit
MIEISDLQFAYSSEQFCLNINLFELKPAEKLAVIGPSGSGKTTLLNLIAGILLPNKGSIRVNDVLINQCNESQRRVFRINHIGFMFQNFELIEYLNVYDNILFCYRINNALKLDAGVYDRINQLARRVGILSKLKKPVNELSQGEKQRVAICRALVVNPALLLADEATGNLDPENKILTLQLLMDMVDQHGSALLAVTHDHELLPYFDRVVDFSRFITKNSDE